MGRYCIRVATGASLFAGSHNRVRLWLVGAHGETKLELELRPVRGQVSRRERGPPPRPELGLAAGGQPRGERPVRRGIQELNDSWTALAGTSRCWDACAWARRGEEGRGEGGSGAKDGLNATPFSLPSYPGPHSLQLTL